MERKKLAFCNKKPKIEYFEGEILDKFLLTEIDFSTKIKIIEEILFSVYYIHSNGFYYHFNKLNNRFHI